MSIDQLEARKIGGDWYLQSADGRYRGQGNSLQAALEDLEARRTDHEAFSEKTGLPIFDDKFILAQGRKGFRGVKKSLAIILVVSLCAIPVTYLFTMGIGRILTQVKFTVEAVETDDGEGKTWSVNLGFAPR